MKNNTKLCCKIKQPMKVKTVTFSAKDRLSLKKKLLLKNKFHEENKQEKKESTVRVLK